MACVLSVLTATYRLLLLPQLPLLQTQHLSAVLLFPLRLLLLLQPMLVLPFLLLLRQKVKTFLFKLSEALGANTIKLAFLPAFFMQKNNLPGFTARETNHSN
jgi:hypothetical protein